ncbi:MAG TPA: hypothetical protein VMW40_08735 [Candidatus Bathyarchaeia archaeon]|nr:hypothetical protein [Candidatus Bathyarchaeia archaeon]
MNKDKKKGIVQRLKLKVLLVLSALMMLPGMAAAATVNFTSVVEILEATVAIFPPLVLIIIAVVPVLIIVAIVSFVMGLFGAILDGITGAFRGMR